MELSVNALGQHIGFPLSDWVPPPTPPRASMQGCYCWLEPLDLDRHAEALFQADAADATGGAGLTWLTGRSGTFPAIACG